MSEGLCARWFFWSGGLDSWDDFMTGFSFGCGIWEKFIRCFHAGSRLLYSK